MMVQVEQQPVAAKADYDTPSIKEYGAVADLVANTGIGSFDDGNGGGAQYAS